jgi:hypothetical protein
MPALMKRKRAIEPVAEPSLQEKIENLRAEVNAFIDDRVRALKDSPDGRGLPLETVRQILTRGDPCLCAAASRMLKAD